MAAQEVDGSFTYSVMSADQRWSPSDVNLTRFALPHLKTFEVLTGDTPVGDRLDLVSATFFNGEGIWLMGPSQSAFSPRVRAYIRHMRKVMRTHLDCFTSSRVTPLFPCKPLSVFANEFRGNGHIIYTLHNPTSTTIRAVTLPLAPSSARWQDAWNDRAVFARRAGGGSEVHVVLEPHSVTCVTMTLPIKAGPTASR